MTMTQKILAAHAGLPEVKAGQLIMADIDLVLGNDITTPVAVNEFRKTGFDQVFDKQKIAIVPDHFTPNKDIKAAEQCRLIREFAHEMEIEHYFEVGEMGIEHALIPEQGLAVPGDVIIGADSTPALTVLWAPLPPELAAPTWRRPWPQGKPGSKCRRRSSLTSPVSPANG